jgi:hypothetical protein
MRRPAAHSVRIIWPDVYKTELLLGTGHCPWRWWPVFLVTTSLTMNFPLLRFLHSVLLTTPFQLTRLHNIKHDENLIMVDRVVSVLYACRHQQLTVLRGWLIWRHRFSSFTGVTTRCVFWPSQWFSSILFFLHIAFSTVLLPLFANLLQCLQSISSLVSL